MTCEVFALSKNWSSIGRDYFINSHALNVIHLMSSQAAQFMSFKFFGNIVKVVYRDQ